MSLSIDLIDSFRQGLCGLPVSHVWKGQGSALFVEFGELTRRVRRNGTLGNPDGAFGLMIEWSWRIEGASTILCGSWSVKELWEPTFKNLVGRTVEGLTTLGRLPEIAVTLSGDMHVVSFMTSDGQPEWALFDRRAAEVRTIYSSNGEVCKECL
jgi:hypothetical protein